MNVDPCGSGSRREKFEKKWLKNARKWLLKTATGIKLIIEMNMMIKIFTKRDNNDRVNIINFIISLLFFVHTRHDSSIVSKYPR